MIACKADMGSLDEPNYIIHYKSIIIIIIIKKKNTLHLITHTKKVLLHW